MNTYQITLLEKDEIHIPKINELAYKFDAVYNTERTKDGLVYILDFSSYTDFESFRQEIKKLNIFQDTGI